MKQNLVCTVSHTQEWERFDAGTGTVYRSIKLHAQATGDVVPMSTRGTGNSPLTKTGMFFL
jgi:hypothetical protein